MKRLRPHLTYANVMTTILAFLVLGGGSALASIIISSNSQVAQDTISGHAPPSGDHSNIISASVNATDLANKSVTPAKAANVRRIHFNPTKCTGPSATPSPGCSANVLNMGGYVLHALCYTS